MDRRIWLICGEMRQSCSVFLIRTCHIVSKEDTGMTQQFGALCLEAVHLHVVIKMYTMGTLPYIVGHVVTRSVTLALLSFAQLVVVTRQP